ncbi:MAG: NAD(+) kinase [Gammaproteobacteria bacterium]|jgi:NAD+ kinase|nr:NAD(+) kinase [Gammaproteobacteria bacterium]MDB9797631.1 NAD(+) kinase [Pseudomonadales bacterium]MBT3696274.1 NAD(+) kinase [Gammaproteobacteria bacterium]MBT5334677.1 NAD(+) kinase [Gammaproteobacteria bacterium]MBT5681417.1 NAD(+) kinase [Gammaproteobacteria bacterium]
MTETFETVAIVARRHSASVIDSVLATESCLLGLGIDVVFGAKTLKLLGESKQPDGVERKACAEAALGTTADLVVVIGGDGSLLGFGRELAASQVPVVGVNRGGLGFLAAISPEQIEVKLNEILQGQFSIEEHFLLEASVHRDGEIIASQTALNDVVINPGGTTRMMEFDLWLDDEFVYDQRSDGLIVATPTGSTAYALSAGGPIMHPGLDAIVIVPMFPHTLTSRPLVVPGNGTLKLRLLSVADAEPQVSCDSQVHVPFKIGDEIIIRKYPSALRLLYPSGHSFYQACRSKLDWASRLGGQRTN